MKKLIQLIIFTLLSQTIFSQTQIGQAIFGEDESNSCGERMAISADGTRMVLGFSGLSLSSAVIDTGFVRVYELNNNVWEQIGNDIEGDDLDVGTGLAVSISADGSRIAFSAPYFTDEGVKGLVRIMEYDGNEWIQLGSYLFSDEINNMAPNFGNTISLSFDGSSIAVGAPLAPFSHGKVYTYKYINEEWILTGELSGSDEYRNIGRGIIFSKNGNRIAIADYTFVRVFDYINEEWTQVGESISDDNSYSTSIATNMDGSRLVTSYPNFNNPKGFVKVYELENSSWTQVGETIQPSFNNGYFGYSTSLSADGNTLVIGAPNNEEAGYKAGLVSLYKYSAGNWISYGATIAGDSGDFSGSKVRISSDGSTVAIGSPSNDIIADYSGLTKVYKINENSSSFETISTCETYQPLGAPDITWSETGWYNYKLPNYKGADSVVFVNLTIEPVNINVTNSDTILMANLENANYQWLDCNDNYSIIDGANEQVLTGVGNGTFAVQIEQNGCIDTSACYELLLTNTEEFTNSKKSIKIFPNPANKHIYIKDINQGAIISIYDTSGKMVKRLLYNNSGCNISELKTGIYHLFVEDNNQISFKKFIKN